MLETIIRSFGLHFSGWDIALFCCACGHHDLVHTVGFIYTLMANNFPGNPLLLFNLVSFLPLHLPLHPLHLPCNGFLLY